LKFAPWVGIANIREGEVPRDGLGYATQPGLIYLRLQFLRLVVLRLMIAHRDLRDSYFSVYRRAWVHRPEFNINGWGYQEFLEIKFRRA